MYTRRAYYRNSWMAKLAAQFAVDTGAIVARVTRNGLLIHEARRRRG